MNKGFWVALALVLMAVVVAQAAFTVTVDGKTQGIKTLERNGEVYLEAKALAKALGVAVVVDAKKRTVAFAASAAPASAVQGTEQLAGGVGEIGKTYTLELGTNEARNFTLNKVEYVAGHFVVGAQDLFTREGKYAVFYATVQNPQKSGEIAVHKVSLSGVDSNNQTVGMAEAWYDPKTRQATFAGLKPGQKLDVFTYMPLTNAAALPKLIVKNGDKVIRYDLAGKVGPLPAPLSDPSNPSVALETLKGANGTWYPSNMADFKVDGFALSTQAVGGVELPEGGRLLVVNFAVRAVGPSEVAFGSYNIVARLRDGDNSETEAQATLLGARDASFDVRLGSGQAATGRFVFALGAGQKASSLKLEFNNSRSVVFDLSNLPQ